LFVQHILEELAPNGRCAIVLDDGFLFRKDESAFLETKRKLVDECDLWAIVSLPGGVFVGAGAAVKTNLLFFTKGRKTSRIWYYDFTHVKVGKKSPMTLAHFGFGKSGEALDDADLPASLTDAWKEDEANADRPFPSYARLLKKRGTKAGESRYSWTVDFSGRRKQAREDMRPHQEEAERARTAAVEFKEQLKARKAAGADAAEIEKLEGTVREQEKAARDAQAKANAIDASAFDLKAVNPNAVIRMDERNPEEVICSIEAQGQI